MTVQYPSVFRKELARLEAKAEAVQKRAQDAKAEAVRILKKDPDSAYALILEASGEILKFGEEITDARKNLITFDQARRAYPGEVGDVEASIRELKDFLGGLAEAGYTVDIEKELEGPRMALARLRDPRGSIDVPDYPLLVQEARGVRDLAGKIRNAWEARLNQHQENLRAFHELESWYGIANQTSLRNQYEVGLKNLKKRSPEEIWEPVASNVEKQEKIGIENSPRLLAELSRLNTDELQRVAEATSCVKELRKLKAALETAYLLPQITFQEFEAAKIHSHDMDSDVLAAIKSAESATSDSDAGGTGKSELRGANGKMEEAKRLANAQVPNWFLVAAALAAALAAAKAAERSARARIEEVEAQRRRRREEEERRRRREEEEEERRRSSYSSWSSGGSSGGSSFGGFGGGSFGGGGASGGW